MRTVTLELLRHGPPNNQLLSPLTQYLALCENHSAVTVRIPFMHNQFLHRLRALSYNLGDEARAFQLQDTAAELRDVIAQVPGLIAELSSVTAEGAAGEEGAKKGDETPLAHLRLVISASELSLLPFELALAPNGFPGAGQSLLLQSQYPLSLTRETRRVAERSIEWPKQPKILFVAASPPEVGPIPVEAHLLALRRLIDPYVGYWGSDSEREREIGKLLLFLPNATAEATETACATGGFSHIHILAHGKEYMEGYDVRYGIAFHNPADPDGPADVVGGERLKTILRPTRSSGAGTLSRPTVVTLASCNTGKVGTVYGMGGSIAHALHEAGLPLVIAGQFPISFAGSVMMVEVLYEGLLWGKDPRISISDLRRRLHSQFPRAHDWASVVAYASFPPGFEEALNTAQIDLARKSVDVAIDWADRATESGQGPAGPAAPAAAHTGAPAGTETRKPLAEFSRILEKINAARDRMKSLLAGGGSRARICHQLASTEKRRAEVYLVLGELLADAQAPEKATRTGYVTEFYRSMLEARRYYWAGFMADRTPGWRVVQYLSLHLILTRLKEEFVPAADRAAKEAVLAEGDHNRSEALWSLAQVFSLNDLRGSRPGPTLWALTDLIELNLLGLLIPKVAQQPRTPTLEEEARRYARAFVTRTDLGSREHGSVSRQIRRYVEWYKYIANIPEIVPLADEIVRILDQGAMSVAGN